MNSKRPLIIAGAAYATTSVILGAFGAHALETHLDNLGTRPTWVTAVEYQMWHALALLLLASLPLKHLSARAAAACFFLGIPLFSGSLYVLALNGPRWLGPVTPLGGLLFIVGWILLVIAAVKSGDE